MKKIILLALIIILATSCDGKINGIRRLEAHLVAPSTIVAAAVVGADAGIVGGLGGQTL